MNRCKIFHPVHGSIKSSFNFTGKVMMEHMTSVNVIYSDEHLIAVDKPAGLPVHRNDFMPHDAPFLTKIVGNMTGKWIRNVHRLDSKTSGVVVLAFTPEAAHELTTQFEQRKTVKTYFALVKGNPGSGSFDQKVLAMKKSKFKKSAVTHFSTLETVRSSIASEEMQEMEISLVKIVPETGRWHQIRQHFSKNRFDILGDVEHGDFTLNKFLLAKTGINRLMLHAGELEVNHPVTGEKMVFTSPLPELFKSTLSYLRNPL